tara:strand:- start:1809 stop:3233 length:1425 start_codon:yes stop_codon:yes gene_type:complete
MIINESFGIMCLSSYLKEKGHEVELIMMSDYINYQELTNDVRNISPDLIGFSVMTEQAQEYEKLTNYLKDNIDCLIGWGGPHPTFMPEVTAKVEGVDFISIGEAEETLLELMNRLTSKNRSFENLEGFWIRNGPSGWIKNPVAHLQHIEKYPFPDRALYFDKYEVLRNFSMKRFFTGRGCPYNCNYCCDPVLKTVYTGKGKLVRYYSVDYIIRDILNVIQKYPTKSIRFADDNINLGGESWLKEFAIKYKEKVNIPFTCNLVAASINEEQIRLLKEAGCCGVTFGLESGVEEIRLNILNKKVKDSHYFKAARMLRKYSIKYMTFNMFLLPSERLDDAIKTLQFNKKLKVHGVRLSILKIFKGTKLAEYVKIHDLVEDEGLYTLKAKDLYNEHTKMRNIIWCGYFLVKFPLLMYFAKIILSTPITNIFKLLFLFTYWQEMTFFKISPWIAWRYFWATRKVLISGIANEQKDVYKK